MAERYEDTWTHEKATCQCVRCRGFQPGNTFGGAVEKHGVYAPLKLAPEAEAMADLLRPSMPVQSEAFEGALQTYCILLARIQRAHTALEKVEQDRAAGLVADGDEPLAYLRDEIRKWSSSALKYQIQLGLTPMSASAIARNIGPERTAATGRPLTQQELKGVSLDKLRDVKAAIEAALAPEPYVDAE